MEGYSEVIAHMDGHLEQKPKEGHKEGWMNALVILKHDQNSALWSWGDPGFLSAENVPSNWTRVGSQ